MHFRILRMIATSGLLAALECTKFVDALIERYGYLRYFSIVTSCRLCKTCLKRERDNNYCVNLG